MNERLVDAISWNGYLRQIVKKIVQQNLRGQHRKEWEKHRGRRHAKHVPKIRARPHQQILHHVTEDSK